MALGALQRCTDIFNEICMFCALTSILLVYSAPSLSLSLSLCVCLCLCLPLCLCCVYLYPFVWVSLKAIHSRDQSAAFVAERILLAQILTCKYDDDAPWKWYKSLINIIKFAYPLFLSLPLSLSQAVSLSFVCFLFAMRLAILLRFLSQVLVQPICSTVPVRVDVDVVCRHSRVSYVLIVLVIV